LGGAGKIRASKSPLELPEENLSPINNHEGEGSRRQLGGIQRLKISPAENGVWLGTRQRAYPQTGWEESAPTNQREAFLGGEEKYLPQRVEKKSYGNLSPVWGGTRCWGSVKGSFQCVGGYKKVEKETNKKIKGTGREIGKAQAGTKTDEKKKLRKTLKK